MDKTASPIWKVLIWFGSIILAVTWIGGFIPTIFLTLTGTGQQTFFAWLSYSLASITGGFLGSLLGFVGAHYTGQQRLKQIFARTLSISFVFCLLAWCVTNNIIPF